MRALDVAERALAAAAGPWEAEAVVHAERSGLARFAASEIHQPTLVENVSVQLRLLHDGRAGVAAGNRLDGAGLAELAARAREVMESAAADPDAARLAEPEPLPATAGFDEATAALAPEDQARLATAAIDSAGGFPVYGFFTSGACELAIASTAGLRAADRFTDAAVLVLAADEGSSGYAERSARAAGALDLAAVAREAVEKARRTRRGVPLEPGTYRAVLEPYAFGELLQWFSYDAFSALALEEERSAFTGRIGERVLDPKISIADDALDPRGLPKAFDFEGTPKRRVDLVEAGVVRGVVWDRTTAARAGRGSTGHALPAASRSWGPSPFALSVAGGEAGSVEELVELVGDGVYVTRFHYLGVADSREGIVTGMTRDGTFRIRGGRIAEPLVNLRFTVSVPELLGEVPGLTREVRLVNQSDYYDERYPYGALVPAVATARFAVTGNGSGPGL